MAHDFNIEFPGDPTFAPLAVRLLQEAGTLEGGPGEQTVDPFVPVFKNLVARLLTALRDDPSPRTLAVGLTTTADGLTLRLAVTASSAGASATSLLAEDDPTLAAARGVFDSVQMTTGGSEAAAGGGLEILLAVGPVPPAD